MRSQIIHAGNPAKFSAFISTSVIFPSDADIFRADLFILRATGVSIGYERVLFFGSFGHMRLLKVGKSCKKMKKSRVPQNRVNKPETYKIGRYQRRKIKGSRDKN